MGTQTTPDKRELVGVFLVLVLATYFLAPANWEPSPESLDNWAGAKVFRVTGGFPVFHHAPLYNLYLQIFLCFEYPFSVQLEHFTTHLFTYTALYIFLRRFLPILPSLFLVCAWIPTLWGVEGGSRILGMGFFSLYLGALEGKALTKGFLPLYLLIAALVDQSYLMFFWGHFLGMALIRYMNEESVVNWGCLRKGLSFSGAVKLLILGVVALTFIFPSQRPDYNVWVVDYPWVPIPVQEIYFVSFIQWLDWYYVVHSIPPVEWINSDWYLIHEMAFGGAQSLLQAVVNNPVLVWESITRNLVPALIVPSNFIVGFSFKFTPLSLAILCPLAWILLVFSLYKFTRYTNSADTLAQVYSLTLGTCASIAALLPIHLSPRYTAALLPVGLLLVVYVGTSLQQLVGFARRFVLPRVDSEYDEEPFQRRIAIGAGSVMVLTGLAANEWLFTALFSNDGEISLYFKCLIWVVDLLLVGAGLKVIMRPSLISSEVSGIRKWEYTNAQNWPTFTVVMLIAGCVCLSSVTGNGARATVANVGANPFALSGVMNQAHKGLMEGVDENTRILSMSDTWLKTFTDVDLDNVYSVFYLPPFRDSSGDTERFLQGLDVIWVSDQLATEAPSQSTQSYLRYKLHIRPFLKDALINGWTMRVVEGYGKTYHRPDIW